MCMRMYSLRPLGLRLQRQHGSPIIHHHAHSPGSIERLYDCGTPLQPISPIAHHNPTLIACGWTQGWNLASTIHCNEMPTWLGSLKIPTVKCLCRCSSIIDSTSVVSDGTSSMNGLSPTSGWKHATIIRATRTP